MQRLARYNFGLGGLLLGMAALRVMMWPLARPAEARPSSPYRPLYCDYVRYLGAVYLNDGIQPPAAFQNKSGTLSGERAAFQVYILTDDPRYFQNVTVEVLQRHHGRRALTVQVKAAPGSHEVAGHWYYTNASNQNAIYYTPKRAYPKDRFALVTFTYHCGGGANYSTTFTLKIPSQPPSGEPDPRQGLHPSGR